MRGNQNIEQPARQSVVKQGRDLYGCCWSRRRICMASTDPGGGWEKVNFYCQHPTAAPTIAISILLLTSHTSTAKQSTADVCCSQYLKADSSVLSRGTSQVTIWGWKCPNCRTSLYATFLNTMYSCVMLCKAKRQALGLILAAMQCWFELCVFLIFTVRWFYKLEVFTYTAVFSFSCTGIPNF